MKGLQNLIRVHKWKLDEKRRELSDFETLRDGFAGQLEKLIEAMQKEQEVAAEHVEVSFSYASYARAARDQQENLQASIEELDEKIALLNEEVAECFQELKKYEIAVDIRSAREKYQRRRVEQTMLDDMAIDMHRRKNNQA